MLLTPLLGEYLWHSVTFDTGIAQMSDAHLRAIEAAMALRPSWPDPLVMLEVGAYAHFSGDRLADERGADVTLLDMSPSTLRVGQSEARRAGLGGRGPLVRRVAADFHELPFPDGVFDLVFIASSVHHTVRWRTVVDELLRVTAPGGLLAIENEPCRRAFCAYAFRCNRPPEFTPLEQELDAQGLLRTVAEPYLGSRPETLFGMTENTSIPLDELVGAVRASADLLFEHYTIESCVAPFEQQLIDTARRGVEPLLRECGPDLVARLQAARTKASEVSRGLEFTIPDDARMLALLEQTAPALAALPPTDDSSYRYAVASIFGAAVKLIAQKRGGVRNDWALTGDVVEVDGVWIAHPEPLRSLLTRRQEWFPDIQASSQSAVAACCPEPFWAYERNAAGIAAVSLRASAGPIHLPARTTDEALLLMRCNFGVTSPIAAEFSAADGRVLARIDLFQSEARLVRVVAPRGVDRIDVKLIERSGQIARIAGCAVSVVLGLELTADLRDIALASAGPA
jgi:hypothetical protein